MRKRIKIKMHNDSKKFGIPIIEKKINLMTPVYLPRKINITNIEDVKSPKRGSIILNDNKQNISLKNKNVNISIKNNNVKSNDINKDKEIKNEKTHQKTNYSNIAFISETLSRLLNKKKEGKNGENTKNKKIDLNDNKENIRNNCNDKTNISINLNNYKKINKFENNLNINNIMLQNNNYCSSQRNNYIKKKIITFRKNDNIRNDLYNLNSLRSQKENNLSDNNRTQNIRKKICSYINNDDNCSSNRIINNYSSNNFNNYTNNINNFICDNSFVGNTSSFKKRKISFYDLNYTPESSNHTNYKIKDNSENKISNNSYLDNILSFRKIKPKIFYKSPLKKYSQAHLQTGKISRDLTENRELCNYRKKSFILKGNLIKYPSSRDTTFKKLNIKNNLNTNNQNSFFSLNYTNTDTNDNTSMDSCNKKILEKLKKNSKTNFYLKLKKENIPQKLRNLNKYIKKDNTNKKKNNKMLSSNLKYKCYEKEKFKKLSHRTLSHFNNRTKKESNLVDVDDIIIKVINDNDLSIYKKEKHLSKSSSSLNNHKSLFRNDKANISKNTKNKNITPKKNQGKNINKVPNNFYKKLPQERNNNEKQKNILKKEILINSNTESKETNKNDKNNSNAISSATTNHKYNSNNITKTSSNSSFILNEEIKNININLNTNLNSSLNKINDKNNEDENNLINFDILYTLESKLKILLIKINNYQICYNECQDLLSYFFGVHFYEKELNYFNSEQNKNQILHYIKFELLCYLMCYDISFNKNYSQTSILLKTIFNLLHKNFLILISYIIKKIYEKNENKDNSLVNSNNYVEQMIIIKKLQEVIKNELKMNLGIQDVNESVILQTYSDNFKQINNYYEMIIENVYPNINDGISDVNSKKANYFKFPDCLKINILKLNDKKKTYIISEFFKSGLKSINSSNIKEFKLFFNLYLNKSTDNLFIQQYFNNKRIYSLIPYPPPSPIMNPEKIILPPINTEKYNYTLILDLDETLIYLEREYYTFNNIHNIKNKKLTLRPGLFNFLDRMKKIYELVLFTFSSPDYSNPIIELIEKNEKYFEHVLYIQQASYNNGEYVKNINHLNRDLKNTIIIEDNINNIHKLNRDNAICIKPFYGDEENENNTLQLLGNILNKIRYDAEITGDITKSLLKEKYNIITEISSNLEE